MKTKSNEFNECHQVSKREKAKRYADTHTIQIKIKILHKNLRNLQAEKKILEQTVSTNEINIKNKNT